MGVWHEDIESLQSVIVNYFHNIFYSDKCSFDTFSEIQWTQVSVSQNNDLLAPVSREEVREAIFAMHPDKSPGLNGFNPAFFQKFWSTVGSDIVEFCH